MDSPHGGVAGRERPDVAENFINSARVWLVLIAYLVLVELFIVFVGAGLESDPRAALFSVPSLALFAAAGLVGLFFASRTGFPAAWDERISNRQRLLLPLGVGMGFGLLTTAVALATNHVEIFKALMGIPAFNAPFPGSLLFYSGGAILVEVLYRLLPIPLLLWLISNVALRGRWQNEVFWGLAILSSAMEPTSQDLMSLPLGVPLFLSLYVPDYAFNLTQALFFRKYGFLAALFVRLGDYLIWHIIYGNLICNC